ncbi:MAG: hypothetical protein ACI89L_000816 [Phycisphaerales bacterium]|jgi:hypothetical protein
MRSALASHRAVLWTVALLSLPAHAWAQPTTPGLATPEPAAPAVRLSSTPYQVESLGLRLYLPQGATATTDPYGSATVTTIIPENNPGTITVQSRTSSNETLTVQDVADGIISSMRGTNLLTRNQGLSIHGNQADRFYLKAPASRGAQAVMRGITVFKVADGHFAILELICDESNFQTARPIYEATVASAEFVNSEAYAERLAASLEASSKLLRSLSVENYAEALKGTNNRWERLYTPAPSGDEMDAQEHGYRRIKAWDGHRGELTPNRSKNLWSTVEKQSGHIVQIDAKLIDDAFEVHTEAIYFLSDDRREEAWTLRMALKQGERPTVWTETGARSGSTLTVSVRQDEGTATTVEPTLEGQGYLSVLETQILGPLLIASGKTGEYSFHTYQSSSGQVRLRTDTLTREENDGEFRMVSSYEDGTGPQTSLFDKSGRLLRVEQPDGRVWEPIEQNRLVRLWDAKGLLDE